MDYTKTQPIIDYTKIKTQIHFSNPKIMLQTM